MSVSTKALVKNSWNQKGTDSVKTCLMGILNITPDSFYDGGRFHSVDQAVQRALQMEREGADIIDIGGESSRPGSEDVTVDEEIRRIIPVLEACQDVLSSPISLDTSRSHVLKKALSTGKIAMVNDIYACRRDPEIIDIIAESGLSIVIMHMKGNPGSMQADPHYDDVISEILSFFEERISCIRQRGVLDSQIIIDPGIGFGKRLEDNISILKNMEKFKALGYPVLIGPSRKSFIGMITNKPPDKRIWGTASAVSCAVLKGADIVRVHDVQEMKDVIAIADRIKYHEC